MAGTETAGLCVWAISMRSLRWLGAKHGKTLGINALRRLEQPPESAGGGRWRAAGGGSRRGVPGAVGRMWRTNLAVETYET